MRKNSSDTMLSMTADSESKDNFEAVMAALEDNLTPAEVKLESSKSLFHLPSIFRHRPRVHLVRFMG